MKIEINIQKGEAYYISPIYDYLKLIENKFNFTVSKTDKGIHGQVFINGKYKAYIDYADYPTLMTEIDKRLIGHDVFIFKYQYHPDYKYKENVVSAGYIGYGSSVEHLRKGSERNIDVIARMRTHQDHASRRDREWSISRNTAVNIAKKLADEGFNTRINKINVNDYITELWQSKIGYNWRGLGALNFKIIEYLQTGVVMLSDDLTRFPIREDVYLEHNKTAIFCEKPEMFYNETKLLLKDSEKIKTISKNCLELWYEKLCPEKHGEWYYNKLKQLI